MWFSYKVYYQLDKVRLLPKEKLKSVNKRLCGSLQHSGMDSIVTQNCWQLHALPPPSEIKMTSFKVVYM